MTSSPSVGSRERVAELAVVIDAYALEGLSRPAVLDTYDHCATHGIGDDRQSCPGRLRRAARARTRACVELGPANFCDPAQGAAACVDGRPALVRFPTHITEKDLP